MKTASVTQQETEKFRRDRLQREKPFVLERLKKINERLRRGIATPMIDIAYNYACNLKCQHCAAAKFAQKDRKLTVADLRRISDEAYDLGLCQFVLSGGEPLILKDLREVITALQPDKFHLGMSTNGYFLTKEMAKNLKSWGLDKVKISIDDFDEKQHDSNRNSAGAYQKALTAMHNADEAGLSVAIQAVVSHQNCRTEKTLAMAKFAQDHGFSLDIIVARAIGAWEGKHEVLIDAEDATFLRNGHDQYPALHRDTFPTYGVNRGCNSVKALLHITQYGDVLPCVFIHIAIGNIFEESLAEIIKRGQHIKCFNEYNPLCLSGEDRCFIDKYMTKFYGKPLPIHWSEAFDKDDFVT